MKHRLLITTSLFFFLVNLNYAQSEDSHNSIYTQKIKRVVNAVDIGDFNTESGFIDVLKTACERNKCSTLETQTIQSIGQQMVFCRVTHLKAHGIDNPSATTLCNSKQAMYGCDSLATPLFRKMCYTGNNYNLKVWQQKESKYKSRMPASVPKK